MKILFFIFFLTISIFAKDNFLYDNPDKEVIESIKNLEAKLQFIKNKQSSTNAKIDTKIITSIEKNRSLINKNSSDIEIIKTFSDVNEEKITQIAQSLNSIKNILKEASSKTLLAPTNQIKHTIPHVKKATTVPNSGDTTRQDIQIDNLMNRVLIMEKELKSIKVQNNKKLNMVNKKLKIALYEYFEYFVISTVALFFFMFIIIFILANKTKNLHLEVEKLIPSSTTD